MEKCGVCPLLEAHQGASHSAGNVFWSHRQHAIKRGCHVFVSMQCLVSESDLLEYRKITWIQLQRMLHFLERFLPATLTPVNVGSQKWNPRLVRQRLACEHQLLLRAVIIRIRPIIMLSNGQMSLSRFGAQPANRLNYRLRQFQARFGVVGPTEIDSVMRSRQLAIGIKKRRIARHCLVKKAHGFEQIFP